MWPCNKMARRYSWPYSFPPVCRNMGNTAKKCSPHVVSADSYRRDAVLTDAILHLDFLHHLNVSETAKKEHTYCLLFISGKNNSDSVWYKYISSHSWTLVSFICVFIFFLELPALLCKGCLCLRWSDRTAQLSVKCWDPGSWPAL